MTQRKCTYSRGENEPGFGKRIKEGMTRAELGLVKGKERCPSPPGLTRPRLTCECHYSRLAGYLFSLLSIVGLEMGM